MIESPTRDKKSTLIDEMIRNEVYLPESGLYQCVKRSLMKLSLDDLESLDLILRNSGKPPSPPEQTTYHGIC
jgi:hypothetical protein